VLRIQNTSSNHWVARARSHDASSLSWKLNRQLAHKIKGNSAMFLERSPVGDYCIETECQAFGLHAFMRGIFSITSHVGPTLSCMPQPAEETRAVIAQAPPSMIGAPSKLVMFEMRTCLVLCSYAHVHPPARGFVFYHCRQARHVCQPVIADARKFHAKLDRAPTDGPFVGGACF
jgi:hypothetical protein